MNRFLFHRIFLFCLIAGLCLGQEWVTCQYTISRACAFSENTCFKTIDEALQKIKASACDSIDILLTTSPESYPLEFTGQAYSGNLKYLRIMSQDFSSPQKVVVNDANVQISTQSLFINNVDFVLNRTLKYSSVFELSSDSVNDPICSLNQVTLTGANNFTMGSFLQTSGYKVVLEDILIKDNNLFVSETSRSFFEFFYISNNSTFREEWNNTVEAFGLSFIGNIYQLLDAQQEEDFLKAAAIEMGSIDVNETIANFQKHAEERALLLRIDNVIHCSIQSSRFSNNMIYGTLIKVSPLVGSTTLKVNFSNLTYEKNIVNYGAMISLYGNIEDAIIKELKFKGNSLSEQSCFISLPLNFKTLTFDNVEMSQNMLSRSSILAPLNGVITPILQLNLYGIIIKNFNFTQNTFKEGSTIIYVKNYDSGVELSDWNFIDNTFFVESNPVTLIQVPELKVARTNFMGNYMEDVLFRVSIALQVYFIDNSFQDFIPPSPSRLVGSYSTGGILEGEICQGGTFSNNTVKDYFSLNYKAFSIIDYRCSLAFNETQVNNTETNASNREKFTFKNNTFELCYVIGYNDFNSLISIQLHEKEHLIEFYDNAFHRNTLESNINFVRSATNIIIYSTMSTVIISNCNFTSNQANSQIPNVGIFAQALTVFNSSFSDNGLEEVEGIFSNYTNLATTGGALAIAVNDLNISSCMFISNQAERGAALYLERSNLKLISPNRSSFGTLAITNCTFLNNRAEYGGAIYFDSSQINQTLDVTNSKFILNSAVFAGGSFFFDGEVSSKLPMTIESSEFEENTSIQGGAIFYLATSNLTVVNCTFYYSKVNLLTLKHSNSTVVIKLSKFLAKPNQEGESGSELINVDGYFSTKLFVLLVNCSFMDIPSAGNKFASILQVKGTDARVVDHYSNYSNIKFGKSGMILIKEAGRLSINGSAFYNLSGGFVPGDDPSLKPDTRLAVEEDSAAILVKTQGRLLVNNTNFTEVNGSLILVLNTGTQIMLYNSHFERIRGVDGAAVDFHGDIWVPGQSKTQIISGCKFLQCTAETMGGAIIGQAMIYNISNSIFTNCSARTGGAIRILANSQVSVTDSLFRRNKADYGAAISYNSSTSPILQNNRFDRNNATIYGSNTASFASNIVLKIDNDTYAEYNFTNQTTKQSLRMYETNNTKLEFHLIDDENQTVKDDNLTLVSLHIETQDKETHQLLLERAVSGVVTVDFQSIVLYGLPGNTSILYATQKTTNKFVKINIFFRECELGEILDPKTKSCFRCGPGTYAIHPNDTECHACPKDAICYGGYNFHLKPGFWRASINSTNIISCGERAQYCEGGLESKCANDTGGVLCESCNSSATPPFVKDVLNQCVVCDGPRTFYGLRIMLVVIGIILLGVILFYFILKSNYSHTREGTDFKNLTKNKRSKNFGVYLRITLMYCQLLMLLKNFDSGISQVLTPLYNVFGDPIVNILFWARCWIALVASRVDQVFFEYIITVVLPILAFLVLLAYIGLVKKGYFPRSKGPEYFSALILIFTWLQPQLLLRHFSMMFCTEISEGVWYLKQYVDVQCEGPSFMMRQTLNILGVISWGFLLPLYLLLELNRERKNLKDSKTHVKLGFLYHGYHTKYYYWYFVTHALKTAMVMVTSLWVHSTPNQGITLMLICLIYLILLTRYKPYHDQYANETEIDVLLVYISLVFFITKYSDTDHDSWLKIIWCVLIILAIVYSLIKILGGVFLSVKETTEPLLNWVSRVFFWNNRNKKLKRADKKEKHGKKNKNSINKAERERTHTAIKSNVPISMERSRVKSALPNYDSEYLDRQVSSWSQQESLKQRLLPTVL